MPHRILNVGQCGPDHSSIRSYLTANFDCEVDLADGPEDTLHALGQREYHLVLVNRKLDRDYTDGIEVIRQMKAHPDHAEVPVMLITNYPEHQQAAVEIGALHGFGKLEFHKPETMERLKGVLR